jgi:hypothetical protein
MEVVLLALKESIKETNEDKKYYLEKLDQMNQLNSYISAVLETVADASKRLSEKEKTKDDDDD